MPECLLMRELDIIGRLIISRAVVGAVSARQLIVRSGHARTRARAGARARERERLTQGRLFRGNPTGSYCFRSQRFRATRGLSVQLKLFRRIRENNPRHARICPHLRNSRPRGCTIEATAEGANLFFSPRRRAMSLGWK